MNVGELYATLGVDDKPFGDGLDRMGGRLSDFGKVIATAGAAAGLAVGAALTKGLFDAVGQEAANDRLAAQMGINNPEWAAELGDIAGSLYADNFGESVGQVNEAIRGVLQNGLVPEDVTNEQLERISSKVLTLADVFELDLGGATAAVGQIMRNGLAPDAEAALDIVTRGFQQGVDKSGDFLDTLNEYSTMFRDIGIDAATATGLMSQGLQAGARDADTVADAIKEFAIRGQDASTMSAQGFEAIGLSAAEMTRKVAGGGAGAAEALDLVLDGLRGMEDPVARNAAAVALFGTKAEDLGDALYSLDPTTAVGALGDIGGAADRMAETLGDNAAAKIETFKRTALQGLTNFIGDTVLPGLERFADAARPVFDRVMESVGPFVADLQENVGPTIDQLGRTARSVFEEITTFVDDNRGTFEEWGDRIGSILETVADIWTGVLEAGQVLWDTFGQTILGYVTGTFDAILQVIDGVLSIIKGILDVFIGLFTGDWSRMWDGVKGIVEGAWGIIQGLFDAALNAIKTAVGLGLDALKAVFSGAWDAIKDNASTVVGAVVEFFIGLPGKVISGIGDLAGTLWEFAKTGFGKLKEAASDRADDLMSFVRDLPDRVVRQFGDVGRLLYNIGRDILQGLIDGVRSMFGKLGDIVGDIAGKITGGIGGLLGIRSPSTVMRGFGRNITEGLVLGIRDPSGLDAAMRKVSDAVTVGLPPAMAFAGVGSRAPQGGGSAGLDDRPIYITVESTLDGEVIARSTAFHLGLHDVRRRLRAR